MPELTIEPRQVSVVPRGFCSHSKTQLCEYSFPTSCRACEV